MTLIEKIASRHDALKVEELATMLSFSPGKIYDMVKTNRIPHFKLGSAIRFDPTTTAKWLEKITV
jgi:excisionase family DNA binding protein